MYRTGFINKNNDTYIRMKQGLPPQQLSNDCQQPSYDNYYPQNLKSVEICNSDNLYFINMPPVDYGLKPVPECNEGLKYIRAP